MYHSSYSTGAAEGAAFVAIFLFLLGLVVFGAIASYIINSFLLSRIFKKAGVKSWKAWIPVYNTWRLLELGGQYGWWVLLPLEASTFVGIITLPSSGSSLDPSPIEIFGNIILAGSSITYYVFWALAAYAIGRKLQKEGVFVLWAIFLPIVWLIWLAFDGSRWDESAGAARLDTPDFDPAEVDNETTVVEEAIETIIDDEPAKEAKKDNN